MNSKRTYYLMLAVILLLVVSLFGSVYGINSLLEKQSTQLGSLKAKVNALNNQQTSLTQAKKDIQTYTDLYNIAKVVVPANKDQAEAVRQIVKLAAASGVRIGTISFPSSTLGTSKIGAPSTSTTSNTVATPSAVSSKSSALSQLVPVPNIPGVYTLQIQVENDTAYPATYSQLINFLSGLESNRLTAEVTSVNILPSQEVTGAFSFTLTLNSYIKP